MMRTRMQKIPTTAISILICILISLYCSISEARGPCFLVFHPDTLAWSPELATCMDSLDEIQFSIIMTLTLISIGFNVIAVFKLIYDKVSGITDSQKLRRRKKWIAMFIQNVIQDALHFIDMVNFTLVSKLSDEEVFQFVFVSLSFAMIYFFDG
uniref:7TM_GPCR_Srx domain-containing protein n=1 Tax=Caenorhabditis tropicalis TaxID=1561998 RepID=A0A1I7U2D8_9PELO